MDDKTCKHKTPCLLIYKKNENEIRRQSIKRNKSNGTIDQTDSVWSIRALRQFHEQIKFSFSYL